MRVVVTARDEEKARVAADAIAGERDGAVVPMALDVASGASAGQLAQGLEDEIGRLDVLVNNAAGYVDWSETASGADLEASRALFDVNLFGTWQVTQALLPCSGAACTAAWSTWPAGPARTATPTSA